MARVDYERQAAAFRQNRSLSDEALDTWRQAITPYVPATDAQILDLGSGTGQFAGPMAEWLGARVIAMEPAAAMRSVSMAACSSAIVHIAAWAEAIPLRSSAIDVAWLSTVIHHFEDLRAAISELRRVLVPRGVVLIRGFLAESKLFPWLTFFPGIERSVASFPALAMSLNPSPPVASP